MSCLPPALRSSSSIPYSLHTTLAMIDAKLTTMEMEKLTRTKPYFALVRPRSYLP